MAFHGSKYFTDIRTKFLVISDNKKKFIDINKKLYKIFW